MKKIWIINHYATPPMYGGLTRHHFLAKYIDSKKYKVTLIAASAIHNSNINLIDDKKKYIMHKIDGVNYLHINTCQYNNKFKRVLNMLQYCFRTYRVLKRRIKDGDVPDYIYSSMPHPLSPLVALKIARKFKIPCTVEIRDLWPLSIVSYGVMSSNNIIVKFLYRLEKYIYLHADKLVFTMDGGINYLKKCKYADKINFDKVFNINNGVDLDKYYSDLDKFKLNDKDLNNIKTFKFVYTGSIRYIYNIKRLIDVASAINNKNIVFIIYGDGPFLKEYKQYCVDNHIDNIIFKGFVDSKYIPYILSKADACLLHGEMTDIMQYGMSTNKSFMYLASGKPIISTYPNKYDFIDGKCGITVKSDSNDEYVDAITRIYNLDEETRNKFKNNSLELVKKFDYKYLAKKLIDIIDRV